MLEARLLGTFEIKYKQKPIRISSHPAQSLFAYLILNAGSPQRREKVAGMLWPDSPEQTARENLRHALWRLRKALQSVSSARFLQADDISISFKESPDCWLDTAELEKLSKDASADELIAVLSSYQAELLPGFYDEWVVLQREHLSSVFENNMARLLELLQHQNRWLDVLDWAERWIKLGQKPEPAYQALMSAHAAKGDMSKVATTYERCVRSLKEFGVEPSEQTRALYERLKASRMPVETGSTLPVQAHERTDLDSNLPIALTSFIGRAKDLGQVAHWLEQKRLVTLTGSGGVGKTRLAIEVSQKLQKPFHHRVWWVDLTALNDESLILHAVAQVLNTREIPNQSLFKTLIASIPREQSLLVMDNCEHLISGCARLVDQLLSACPNLRVLATSRETLGLTGEQVWQVTGLSAPDLEAVSLASIATFESISLFVERALASNPDFALTSQNAPLIAQICQRLDGIPLAIELAAARVKMLPVEAIAARLDDRFALLTSGSRTALPRHQTLRAAMDWSYDLLLEKEQILFCRLAALAGDWTLEAAQSICGWQEIESDEVLDLLSHLVDKSLIAIRRHDGEARFHMLETIREYALKKLPDVESIRNRHLEYFLRLAENAESLLHGADQTLWLRKLELEHDNFRVALDWSVTGGNLEWGMKLGGALWSFWDIRGHQLEGRIWLDRLLIKGRAVVPTPNTAIWARVLYVSGHLSQQQGDQDRARMDYLSSWSIYEQLGDEPQIAVVLRGLGEIAQDDGNQSLAKSYYEHSLAISHSMKDAEGTSIAVSHLAILDFLQGDHDHAIALCRETLEIARELGNRRIMAISLTTLGFALWAKGDLEQAEMQLRQALTLQAALTDPRIAQYSLVGMALLALAGDQPDRAAKLLGAADALRGRMGISLPPSQRSHYDLLVESIRLELDEASFEKDLAEGGSMSLHRAIEFALAQSAPQ